MDSYGKLQKLTEPTRPELANTFSRVAEILSKTQKGKPLQLQFSLVDGDEENPTVWSVVIDKSGGKAKQQPAARPDVEIITRPETWWEIAEGRLSPLDAFVTGRLRVQGSIERAKRVFLTDLATEAGPLPEWLR